MARIGIIGTGISGLGAAFLLQRRHDITLYEKAPRIGGHTRTLTVDYDGVPIPVDTGFIVFNERNYPNLTGLFRHLDVPVHKSDMTFAATIADGWLEWGAKDLNSVFGQRRNMLRPGFYKMARDAMRFNALAEETVDGFPGITLGEFLDVLKLGDWFRRFYLLPMAGAIWSCPPQDMLDFPARSFVRFFANHGLLSTSGQPQWYTVTGGAQEYVKRLTHSFSHRLSPQSGAKSVTRTADGVRVTDTNGRTEIYDHLVMACHADEAFSLLTDPSADEATILPAFRYQQNRAVLHRDTSVMPKRKRCWASWVYHAGYDTSEPKIAVSYWMNRLQGIDDKYPLFVTLNPMREIDPEKVFDEHVFEHPMFDTRAVAAQARLPAIQGVRNTWFCGAHWRNGFHEDGLASAVAVAKGFGIAPPWDTAKEAVAPERESVPDWRPVPVAAE